VLYTQKYIIIYSRQICGVELIQTQLFAIPIYINYSPMFLWLRRIVVLE